MPEVGLAQTWKFGRSTRFSVWKGFFGMQATSYAPLETTDLTSYLSPLKESLTLVRIEFPVTHSKASTLSVEVPRLITQLVINYSVMSSSSLTPTYLESITK